MSPAAILCGKNPQMGEFMVKNFLPKVDIIHICTNVESALIEISALLSPQSSPARPSSNLGSNTGSSSPRTDVSLLIIGGGFSKEDVDQITNASNNVKELPVFWADRSATPPGQGPPKPEIVLERMISAIEKEEKDGAWTPGLYRF